MKIRDRIIELRRVKASELAPNPKNWRKHPDAQQNAMRGLLAEIGYAGANIARQLPDGSLQLIDGHLRTEIAGDAEIPVLILDVSEAEADKILATFDPVSAMAEADKDLLDALLGEIEFESPDVDSIHSTPPPQERATQIDPQFSVLVKCPTELDQKIILTELDHHGLETTALCVGWPQPEHIAQDDTPLKTGDVKIVRHAKIKKTPRVKQLSGLFDLPSKAESRHEWTVSLTLDKPWNIGLIVGPSGCGKSTIARELFPHALANGFDWPPDAAVIDAFPEDMSITDITAMLSSVGFSSPPSWLKPFHVLSNGEQFRVNLARTLAEMPQLAVVDEFTSVVDRTVAQIGSAALAKAVRATNRRFIAVTCHFDVEEWLQPDWTYQPATNAFHWRSVRRRPDIHLRIRRVNAKQAWPIFRRHHYLSNNIHRNAACFVAYIDQQPAALTAVLSQPGKHGAWREHRTVCLPDFQGVGIGNRLSEFVAGMYLATGKRYRSTTSHPAMIAHRARSPVWKMIRPPSLTENTATKRYAKTMNTVAANRLTTGFEFIGQPDEHNARRLGVLKA